MAKKQKGQTYPGYYWLKSGQLTITRCPNVPMWVTVAKDRAWFYRTSGL